MKLGLVQFSTDETYMLTNRRKFPRWLLPFYVENFCPFSTEEMILDDTEGVLVTLHASATVLREKENKWTPILEEMLRTLCDQGVTVVVPPSGILFPEQIIKVSHGRAIHGFFVMEMMQKALKLQGKTLKEAQIVLIDGNNFMTKLVLDMVSPNVNYLAVYTDRQEDFLEAQEQIYADTGLALQTFSNAKNQWMKSADIILNCGMDMENYDYAFQKKAIYFDMAGNKEKMKRLLVRRDDLLVADGLTLRKDVCSMSSNQLEAVEYVKIPEFRRFLSSRYDKFTACEVSELLKQQNISVTGLLCMGKPTGHKGKTPVVTAGNH